MIQNLPENILVKMSNFVSSTMGLYYPQKHWSTLQHQTKLAAKEFGFLDIETFVQLLVSTHMTREMIGTLAKHFTIPETYFWREPQAFDALSKQILPELIRAREKNNKRFYHSLIEGGWLLVSASEPSMRIFSQFTTVNFPGTHLFRREANKCESLVVPSTNSKKTHKVLSKQDSEKDKLIAKVSPQPNLEKDEIHSNSRLDLKRVEALMANMLLASEGKLNEALAACEQAIASDKLDITQIYLYASILQEQNQETDAIEAYKRVLYLDPNYVMAHFTLGNLYMRQDKTVSAMRHFKNVQKLLDNYKPDKVLVEF